MRWLLLLGVLLWPLASAHADDREDAAKLLDEGVTLYGAKQYREALDKFEQAYAKFASPKILFNVAGALEQLGREAEAAQAYDRFLVETDSGDAQAQDRIKAARQALAGLDKRLARLRLEPRPPDPVTLDGLAINVGPQRPIYVAPGRHAIEATIDGATRSLALDVAAGEERTIDLRQGQAKKVETTPGVTVKTVRSRRLWTWITGGVAVGFLGAGVIAGRSADAAFERYQAARTLEQWEQERAATKQRATIANVCFIGAGAAAIAASILFFVEGGEHQVIVSAPPSGVGAAVMGRF